MNSAHEFIRGSDCILSGNCGLCWPIKREGLRWSDWVSGEPQHPTWLPGWNIRNHTAASHRWPLIIYTDGW